jgi:hypothetical protein
MLDVLCEWLAERPWATAWFLAACIVFVGLLESPH